MLEWYDSLPELEKAFVAATLLGGTLFAVRLLLSVFSGGDDLDADDFGTGGNGAQASFRILSFQGLSAFMTMFGLVGLALAGEGMPGVFAVGGGVVAGLLTIWVMGRMFVGIGKLESDGTIRLSRAIGVVGTVDLTIPPGGTGKARVIVQQRLRVYDAVSVATVPLRTGAQIRVVDIRDGNVLVVEPHSSAEQREAK